MKFLEAKDCTDTEFFTVTAYFNHGDDDATTSETYTFSDEGAAVGCSLVWDLFSEVEDSSVESDLSLIAKNLGIEEKEEGLYDVYCEMMPHDVTSCYLYRARLTKCEIFYGSIEMIVVDPLTTEEKGRLISEFIERWFNNGF